MAKARSMLLKSKFWYGKHEGETVEDVIESDTEYITWVIENMANIVFSNEAFELYQNTLKAKNLD